MTCNRHKGPHHTTFAFLVLVPEIVCDFVGLFVLLPVWLFVGLFVLVLLAVDVLLPVGAAVRVFVPVPAGVFVTGAVADGVTATRLFEGVLVAVLADVNVAVANAVTVAVAALVEVTALDGVTVLDRVAVTCAVLDFDDDAATVTE